MKILHCGCLTFALGLAAQFAGPSSASASELLDEGAPPPTAPAVTVAPAVSVAPAAAPKAKAPTGKTKAKPKAVKSTATKSTATKIRASRAKALAKSKAAANAAKARHALRESLSAAVAGAPTIAANGDATPPVAANSVAPAASAQAVDLDESDDTDDQLCGSEECTPTKIQLLPRVILQNLGELPVLGAFVMPVTQGVTIEPGQGLPAVTFAVKPTKFTRGSGVVAVSRF